MKYSKIEGTFFKFDGQQKINTGIQYSSQETKLFEQKLVIKTYEKNKIIETEMRLSGPQLLDFKSKSDDPRIPVITGHFFNSEYEECVLSSVLSEQKLNINGVVTKIDVTHALSTKTLTDVSSGKVVAVMQERIELIPFAEFTAATGANGKQVFPKFASFQCQTYRD